MGKLRGIHHMTKQYKLGVSQIHACIVNDIVLIIAYWIE
jgi:hypothetical protein